MCSIIGLLPERSPSPEVIMKMLEWGEKRGIDAFGCIIYDHAGTPIFTYKQKGIPNREDISNKLIQFCKSETLLLISYRAAPETEILSEQYDCIQPIIYDKLCLIHNGAVSNRIYNELKNEFNQTSKLDSEAILWAYLKYGDMKKAMEYLSGGFAFLMADFFKKKLYAVCTHNPLYCGYVKEFGLFFSSMEESIYDTISIIKGMNITRQNILRWEDYYARELPENMITEFDLDSYNINEIRFTPRYIHPKYDPFLINNNNKKKILVASSGGLDSSTTLAILKYSGYDVSAVHFKYGHRGEQAEEIAIDNICNILDIPIVKFDIKENMKILDDYSMLTNTNHKITTGTDKDLKTTIAWTCCRNGLFMTYMGALAESQIINGGYNEVYLTGGFLNLTESGVYVDNSERFMKSFSKFIRFSSIVGTKILPLFVCANLLKTELYIILEKMGLLKKLGIWMISCDRPIVKKNDVGTLIPFNCSKNNKPACGSGALSRWAIDRLGIEDPRRYYNVDDVDYELFEPPLCNNKYDRPIKDIISKIQIHSNNKEILLNYLERVGCEK